MVLPRFNWNHYDEVIGNIGNNSFKKQNTAKQNHILIFLEEIGLIRTSSTQLSEEGNPLIELTDNGKKYFLKKYCTNECKEADQLLKELLLEYRPVKLLIQVLWGNPSIKTQNVKNLLSHYNIVKNDSNIGPFISILNNFDILSYSKKHQSIKFNTDPVEPSKDKDYFISESKPYSNLLKIRKMIEEAKDHIYWFEKHYSPKLYELLSYYSDGSNISEIRILTGLAHINEGIKTECKRLQDELRNKKIKLKHNIIIDKKLLNKIHGRWFLSKNYNYKIPPINTILQGQADEIILRIKKPEFQDWWDKSVNLISEWDKIEKLIGEEDE